MNSERWNEIKAALGEATELEPPERAAFLERLARTDPGLLQELESLMAADAAAEDSFLSVPAPVALGGLDLAPRHSGRRLGPFRLIEEIGAGGMGEVYRAIRDDDEFHQEVAIKLVRAGAESAEIAERLRTERQILASFEHPNIAHLHDGGTTPDGVPYLVMELIAGEPINRYCAGRKLDIGARVELFVQVCAAVQYAHSHMVIHRDLKPSNILVTADGVPKLLDFGIAKILGGGSLQLRPQETLNAARLLTPGYCSPEQLAGGIVTAASDVYSLGILLYELVTGANPFEARSTDLRGLLRSRVEAAPRPPSLVAGHRLGDLDAIVLMALRVEPERRYATAEQLAADLRRYLTQQPVIARRDTPGYRVSKFAERHWAGMTAAALAVIALGAGIVITTTEARIAEAQRARAERRFEDVRRLANSLLFDIHDSIRYLPGAADSRHLLTQTAVKYLDSLAAEAEHDPALQLELAAAYQRLGDVQGQTLEANEGDYAGARRSYEHALTLCKASLEAAPNNPDARRDIVVNSGKLSDLLWYTDQPDAALGIAAQGIENGAALVAAAPGNPRFQQLLAATWLDYGFKLFKIRGETVESLGHVRRSIDSLELLAPTQPDNWRLQRLLSLAYSRAAEMLAHDTASLAEAVSLNEKARTVLTRLLHGSPDNADLQHLMAFTDFDLGTVLIKQGRFDEALTHEQTARQAFEALRNADPKIDEYSLDLVLSLDRIAESRIGQGSPTQALPLLQRALATLADIENRGHATASLRLAKASIQALLGKSYAALYDWQTARDWYQKSLQSYQILAPNFAEARDQAAEIQLQLQRCEAALGVKAMPARKARCHARSSVDGCRDFGTRVGEADDGRAG